MVARYPYDVHSPDFKNWLNDTLVPAVDAAAETGGGGGPFTHYFQDDTNTGATELTVTTSLAGLGFSPDTTDLTNDGDRAISPMLVSDRGNVTINGCNAGDVLQFAMVGTAEPATTGDHLLEIVLGQTGGSGVWLRMSDVVNGNGVENPFSVHGTFRVSDTGIQLKAQASATLLLRDMQIVITELYRAPV